MQSLTWFLKTDGVYLGVVPPKREGNCFVTLYSLTCAQGQNCFIDKQKNHIGAIASVGALSEKAVVFFFKSCYCYISTHKCIENVIQLLTL